LGKSKKKTANSKKKRAKKTANSNVGIYAVLPEKIKRKFGEEVSPHALPKTDGR